MKSSNVQRTGLNDTNDTIVSARGNLVPEKESLRQIGVEVEELGNQRIEQVS